MILFFLVLVHFTACSVGDRSGIACDMTLPEAELAEILGGTKDLNSLGDKISENLKQCPTDRNLLYLGMYSAYRSRHLSGAVYYYEKLVEFGYADAAEHADAAYIYISLMQQEKAKRAFQKSLLKSEDAVLKFDYAKLLYETGDRAEAAVILDEIVSRKAATNHGQVGFSVEKEDAVKFQAGKLLDRIALEDQRP
jgi:tetratricopeptide (TPR) repeat protein